MQSTGARAKVALDAAVRECMPITRGCVKVYGLSLHVRSGAQQARFTSKYISCDGLQPSQDPRAKFCPERLEHYGERVE
jgi:hypothetical protein